MTTLTLNRAGTLSIASAITVMHLTTRQGHQQQQHTYVKSIMDTLRNGTVMTSPLRQLRRCAVMKKPSRSQTIWQRRIQELIRKLIEKTNAAASAGDYDYLEQVRAGLQLLLTE